MMRVADRDGSGFILQGSFPFCLITSSRCNILRGYVNLK